LKLAFAVGRASEIIRDRVLKVYDMSV